MKDLTNLETPYFLFDKRQLSEELLKIKQASLLFWPNIEIAYSVKTNNFPPLLKFLSDQGISSEVVSSDEFELVSLCGFRKDRIICNGPIKSKKWVYAILDDSIKINIDSKIELCYVTEFAIMYPQKTIRVGLRVNSAIETFFLNETNSPDGDSRFGFSYDTRELSDAINCLQDIPNIIIIGLHLHVSTKTRKVEIYEYLANLFCQIVNKFALFDITYLDIGGGFFGGIEDVRNWNSYFERIANTLNKSSFSSENLKIIIEPGVSLIATCFSYYTHVTDVKVLSNNRFVVLDGSRIHIDPFFHKESYFYERIDRSSVESVDKQTLVGFTCLEKDRFFTLANDSEFEVGNLLKFDKLGAYTLSLSPLFISFFPAVYSVDHCGTIQCLRKKWTAKEFIQLSII